MCSDPIYRYLYKEHVEDPTYSPCCFYMLNSPCQARLVSSCFP